MSRHVGLQEGNPLDLMFRAESLAQLLLDLGNNAAAVALQGAADATRKPLRQSVPAIWPRLDRTPKAGCRRFESCRGHQKHPQPTRSNQGRLSDAVPHPRGPGKRWQVDP